jgi:AcrR family transcriptional regulator
MPDATAAVGSGAKTRRGAATRARLVDAAGTVFAECGYSAARISDMVRLAGISQGNFYRHFQSKDEILLAVLEGPLDDLRRASSRQPGAQVILSELVAANRAYFAAYARHRHVIRVMREAAATNRDFGRLWLGIRQGFVDRTTHWLEGLQASDQLEPGANLGLLAETLGSVVEHLAYVRIALPTELPRGELLDDLGRMAGEAWFLILTGRERLGR